MPGQRRDAERNRKAIVSAFVELLSSDGARVPMYRVAQKAGVGQAHCIVTFPSELVPVGLASNPMLVALKVGASGTLAAQPGRKATSAAGANIMTGQLVVEKPSS